MSTQSKMQAYKRHMVTQANNRSGEKKANGKREANKTTIFCEVGERKTRGKWKIM